MLTNVIKQVKKLKGISKATRKTVSFDDYHNCLIGGEYIKKRNNYAIRNLKREFCSHKVKKLAVLLTIREDILMILKVRLGPKSSLYINLLFNYTSKQQNVLVIYIISDIFLPEIV